MKKIVFILDHKLNFYRIDLFNLFKSYGYKVTVIHSGPYIENTEFEQILVNDINFIGFTYRSLPSLKGFDFVVHMQNIRFLNLWLLSFTPFRSYGLIHWGIGTSSSKGLNKEHIFVKYFRYLLGLCSSSNVLYSDFSLKSMPSHLKRKTFVAPNTIHVKNSIDCSQFEKKSFLFIGGLNKRKGFYDLLKGYSLFLENSKNNFNPVLKIVGDGPERAYIENLVDKFSLSNKVSIEGPINDSGEKLHLFKEAFACVSPKQAGLSVLESFSYGIPFISYNDAISGGEHLNIVNGRNGYLLNNFYELADTFSLLSNNPDIAKSLGSNSFKYYHSSRTINHMLQGFLDSIDFIETKKTNYE